MALEAGDAREAQKNAQAACQATLEAGGHRTNFGTVKQHCPDVERIIRGEPMYGSLQESDGDGVDCESL